MPRVRFKLRWLMVAVAALAMISWGATLLRRAGRAELELRYRDRLLHLGFSLTQFCLAHGHLPPAEITRSAFNQSGGPAPVPARPLFSWRVELFPFVDKMPSWAPSLPWNNPANSGLSACSAFYSSNDLWPEAGRGLFPQAAMLAITGPRTAFGDGKGPIASLQDVASDTIVVVESRSSGIPWAAPGDLDIRTMPRTINAPDGRGISGRLAGGFHVIFASGDLWFISNDVPFATLETFFTVDGARANDAEQLLGPYVLHRGR